MMNPTQLTDGLSSAREQWRDLIEQRWVPSWREHDGALMQSCFHPGGSYRDPYFGRVTYERIPKIIGHLARRIDGLDFEVVGPMTASPRREDGTYTLALQWLMTGRVRWLAVPVRLEGCDFLHCRDERIVEAVTYFDLARFGAASIRAALASRRVRRHP